MTGLLPTLASFVPSLVIRRYNAGLTSLDEPSAENFPALVLFADISGFTALTERLAARGPSGAEDLTRYLNTYFGELIALITEAGGDVVKFAGDALLALWPAQRDDELPALAQTVADSARRIQARLHRFEVGDEVALSLKVAIGAGQIAAMQLGGVFKRWELLVAGAPLSQVGVANGEAEPGDVVLSAEAWALLARKPAATALAQGVMRLVASEAPPMTAPLTRVAALPETLDALRQFIPGAIRARLDAGQTDWLAELRSISVVFINLPDFTYDTPLEKAQQATCALQAALYRFEGSINKISVDDKGASLIAVLGLPPLSHEDDPERALRAAQAMHEGLTALGFRSSVGVTTGTAFCGAVGSDGRREYTVMGDVVNLAARLMVAAKGGILCDAPTAAAAGERIDCLALPPVRLKGKAVPVAIFQPGRRREPAQQTEAPGSGFDGRDIERASLRAFLERRDADAARLMVLEAELGLGSRALLDGLAAYATSTGYQVLTSAGDAIDANTPYFVWRQLLAACLKINQTTGETENLRSSLLLSLADDPALAAQAPLLGPVFALEWPETDVTAKLSARARVDALHRLVVAILQRHGERGALLLALSDVQWLDAASIALLAHVHAALPGLQMVLGLRRRQAGDFQSFVENAGAAHLRLGPLDREALARVLSAKLALADIPAAVSALLWERSDGNPYFAEVLLNALLHRGVLTLNDGALAIAAEVGKADEWQIAGTLEGLINASIDRLPAPAQLTLKVASVIGRSFPRRALFSIYPMVLGETALDAHLGELCSHEMLRLPGRRRDGLSPDLDLTYAFRNGLIQDSAYQLMLYSQRRQLHRALALWYEQEHADDLAQGFSTLAYHWRKAGEDGVPDAEALLKAIDYYERAGNRAADAYVNAEAMHFFREALKLVALLPADDALARCELRLQLELGTAAATARSYAAPEVQLAYARASELCRQVGNHAELFRALRGLWQFRQGQGEMLEAARIGQELLDLAALSQDSALLLEAHRLLGNNAYWTGNFVVARRHMEQAVSLFKHEAHAGLVAQFGQDPDVANRGILGWTLGFLGYPEQAQAQLASAVARAEAIDHPFSRVFAYGAAMWNSHFFLQIEQAEHWATRVVALAGERGFPYLQVAGEVVRGWARARQGQPEGLDEVQDAIARWRASGATIGLHIFLMVQANTLLFFERIDEVEATLDDPLLAHRGISERWLESEVLRLRGEVAMAHGNLAEADQRWRQAMTVAEEQHNRLAQLRIASSQLRLARAYSPAADTAEALGRVYASFDEGLELGFMRQAKSELDRHEARPAGNPPGPHGDR